MHQACNSIGCTVIPGGVGNTELQLETISNLKPSFYLGTPSFLKILLEKAKNNKIRYILSQKRISWSRAFSYSIKKKNF